MLLLSFQLTAQPNSRVTYFNNNWQEVKSKENASYYRTVQKIEKHFRVIDYYISGAMQMQAICKKVKPELVNDGLVTWFYPSGGKSKEAVYRGKNIEGIIHLYHSNGQKRGEVMMLDRKVKYIQAWDSLGNSLLDRGNGFFTDFHKDVPHSPYVIVKDSIITGSYYLDKTDNVVDTIYTFSEKSPEYLGGMANFYRSVASSMIYPTAARKAGIEGTVFVKFIISKNGALAHAEVLKGIGFGCDEAALLALVKQTEWSPAFQDGVPVSAQMVLPIMFKLSGRALR